MRAVLMQRRAETQARLDALEQMLVELTSDRAVANDDDEHDPEGVPLSAEWSRLTGITAATREELRQVDNALERVDAGTYGVCVTCGKPIPAARLEIRPFAEQCVTCAAKAGL